VRAVRRRLAEESGVTLIEIVIAVGLLGVVIGPVMVGMMFGLAHSNGTRDRVADSSSAQLLSTYLPGDIQSAATVATSDAGDCEGPVTAGDEVKLRLAWSDPASAAATTTVLYFTRQEGSLLALYRARCAGGAETVSKIVHHLNGPGGFAVSCDGVPCASTPSTPTHVEVTLETFNAASESAGYGVSTYVLSASRRAA
jgi:hypothetical protein